jgi:hypothetical protein
MEPEIGTVNMNMRNKIDDIIKSGTKKQEEIKSMRCDFGDF